MITVEVPGRIESMLRDRTGRPVRVPGDGFDYVAGTSRRAGGRRRGLTPGPVPLDLVPDAAVLTWNPSEFPMSSTPVLTGHRRRAGSRAAILLIHGFGGHPEKTWGEFPRFLREDPRLEEWDLFSVGYATSLAPDLLRGLWRAEPPLESLADLLRTVAALPPLDGYRTLAVAAHSMGGLVAQRALLDPGFRDRVSHLVLFGTPSRGLVKASIMRFWKRQLRDMGQDDPFIAELRRGWDAEVAKAPMVFWAVAGDQDEFVPRTSSIDPFPPERRAVVPGDHLSIVKPRSADDLAVQLLVRALVGDSAPAGPLNSARVAVESRDFARAVRLLEPNRAELDPAALVQLALALDGLGRGADALRVLEEAGRPETDAMGTLAGRLKRRWVAERRERDAARALELYREGFERASAAGDAAQAYYHAVNVAFLQLLFRDEPEAAGRWARTALEHCASAPPDHWRHATEGEAHLVLGDTAAALAGYRRAVEAGASPRELLSMYWQARLVAENTGNTAAAGDLERLFRGEAVDGEEEPLEPEHPERARPRTGVDPERRFRVHDSLDWLSADRIEVLNRVEGTTRGGGDDFEAALLPDFPPEEVPAAAEAGPSPEPVLLGASAPESAAPGEEFIAQLAAYVESAEAEVRAVLLEEARPEDIRLGRKTGCRWKPGTRVTVRLTSPDLRVEEPAGTFEWDGEWQLLQFTVGVPGDAPEGRTVLDFDVFVAADDPGAGGVQVAGLKLAVEVAAQPSARGVQTATTSPARTAFASYASEDRTEVLERVSSISRTSGMDIFVDVVSLRLGDEWSPALEREVTSRDRLLLFWSERASCSRWVRWEWEHFLRARGEAGLELHLLERVPADRIPEPLRKRHFDDVYLLARDAELYRREREKGGGG